MDVSVKNLGEKSLMLIFAFIQIFFSPVYKLDLKTPLLSPVHAQKCNVWLMCGKQSACLILCSEKEGRKIPLQSPDELLYI